ncbi:MAG: class I lanthipeptide [Holophagales bacterium]|nr:class I lanthipeptide [Holophagales bacterium]
MKKKIRRLRLDRETVRNLTPETLSEVAGGVRTEPDCTDTCPVSACLSCFVTCPTCPPCN